jgi:hypothetical protein
MKRMFTSDIGHWKFGETHDWPITTWRGIGEPRGLSLDDFSSPVSDAQNVRISVPNITETRDVGVAWKEKGSAGTPPVKRPRGRPRKYPLGERSDATS